MTKDHREDSSGAQDDGVEEGSDGSARVGLLQHLLTSVEGQSVAADGGKGVLETSVGRSHGPLASERHCCKIEKELKGGQAWAVEGGKLEEGEERDEEEEDEEDVPPVLESQMLEPCLAGLAPEYLKDPEVVEAVRSGLLRAEDFGVDEGDTEEEGSVVGSGDEEEYWEGGEYWEN